MKQSIDDYLSFEIKKELADRYFGFRKLIEDDIRAYDDQVLASYLRLEQKIGYDLVRLYMLLKDEGLILEFLRLAGLQEKLFFDPYLAESPTLRRRVFQGQRVSGLTRAGRFRYLVYENYRCLERHIDEYRTTFMEIMEEQETISEEINLFYRKNDLSYIMGFLRGLSSCGSFGNSLQGALTPDGSRDLEDKMRVTPPPPTDEVLPDISPIASFDKVRKPLNKIIDQAYKLHGSTDWKGILYA